MRGTAALFAPLRDIRPGREQSIALAGLLAVAALAWAYLFWDAARMEATVPADPLAWPRLFLTFLMWTVMMAGMMLPSAAPAILLYGRMVRANRAKGKSLPAAWVFAGGYLAVWALFSLGVTGLQAWLEWAGVISPMMVATNAWFAAALLIASGIYQWLPLKEACLTKCRDPLTFFLMHWRGGTAGAFRMGSAHGIYCVGCCWALMLLLFAAGVMNLLWVALIAAFVFAEKLLPAGRFTARGAGLAMVVAGILLPVVG